MENNTKRLLFRFSRRYIELFAIVASSSYISVLLVDHVEIFKRAKDSLGTWFDVIFVVIPTFIILVLIRAYRDDQ
jgi:hypothetical protein